MALLWAAPWPEAPLPQPEKHGITWTFPWEPKTFVFRGYNPYIGGCKTFIFHGFGVQGSGDFVHG